MVDNQKYSGTRGTHDGEAFQGKRRGWMLVVSRLEVGAQLAEGWEYHKFAGA
jgi:hypothetical protein